MHKFTLSDFMGIVIVIGVIILLTLPAIDKTIKNTINTSYDAKVDTIISAASVWSDDNSSLLPANDGESITIYLSELKLSGNLDKNIKNPKTGKLMSNNTSIIITKKNGKYIYSVNVVDADKTEDTTIPILMIDGDITEYVEVNQEGKQYVIPDAVAKTSTGDSIDSSYISHQITKNDEIVSVIDTSKLDTYTINYVVTYGGKTGIYQKQVIVRDTTRPDIIVNDNLMVNSKNIGTDLTTGIIIKDNSGEDITPKIKTSVSDIPGTYYVYYLATDSSGNTVTKKREATVYKSNKHATGEVVYYNPTNGKRCNDYNINNSASMHTTGCLKWYSFNDSETSATIKLLLDHNIGPDVAYSQIDASFASYTKEWLDTLSPKLLTISDVTKITSNETYNDKAYYFDSNSSKPSNTCKSGATTGCRYGWLYDRTSKNCLTTGCLKNATDVTNGYWLSGQTETISVISDGSVQVDTTKSGVRPTIEVNKSIFD